MATNMTFVDFVTPVPADWLNNVNYVVNNLNFGSVTIAVTNVAAVRTTSHLQTTAVYAKGYYAPADGGGGLYIYDPSDVTSTDNGGTILVATDGGRWKLQGKYSVKNFGAKGDGVTNDAPAIQAAINTGYCYLPYTANGYLVNTCLNATNLTALTMEGDQVVGPQWSLGYLNQRGGSTIFGNTGTWVLDITGSNNVTLKNFNINCMPTFASGPGLSQPSHDGIVGGTSTANPTGLNYPGGSGYIFENISVWCPKNGVSCPIYINNGNIGRYTNVQTLGDFGFCLVSNNPLSVVPPYATFGSIVGSDNNIINGAFMAGYGTQAVLYLENANDLTVLETYQVFGAGLNGGPYSGPGYATYIKNCENCDIKLEVDYFPFMFVVDGACTRINITGIMYQGPTTTPVGNPSIGWFTGTLLKNCNFNIDQPFTTQNSNFAYVTSNAVMATMQNCEFYFDTAMNNAGNVVYFNLSNATAVPFFNLRFNGNNDEVVGTAPFELLVNGSTASASQYRIFVNGNKQGTA